MDDRLVGDLRARRPEGLDELIHRHGAEIQAMAWMILRNASDAEEVTADTLLTAWHKIDSLRDPQRLRPWLLRIATRGALRRRRGSRGIRNLALQSAAEVRKPTVASTRPPSAARPCRPYRPCPGGFYAFGQPFPTAGCWRLVGHRWTPGGQRGGRGRT